MKMVRVAVTHKQGLQYPIIEADGNQRNWKRALHPHGASLWMKPKDAALFIAIGKAQPDPAEAEASAPLPKVTMQDVLEHEQAAKVPAKRGPGRPRKTAAAQPIAS